MLCINRRTDSPVFPDLTVELPGDEIETPALPDILPGRLTELFKPNAGPRLGFPTTMDKTTCDTVVGSLNRNDPVIVQLKPCHEACDDVMVLFHNSSDGKAVFVTVVVCKDRTAGSEQDIAQTVNSVFVNSSYDSLSELTGKQLVVTLAFAGRFHGKMNFTAPGAKRGPE
jgi:hypothetical protein